MFLNYCLVYSQETHSPKFQFQVGVVEAEIVKLNSEQLVVVKENLNTLFSKCVFMLGHEHHIRVAHSLQV